LHCEWPDGKWRDVGTAVVCALNLARLRIGGEEATWCSDRLYIYLFTALNVNRLCPPVLQVTLGCRQCRASGNEVMGIRLFEYLVEERSYSFGMDFAFVGLPYDELNNAGI
jgi:hypothetical protein